MMTAFIFICQMAASASECDKARSIWDARVPESYSTVEDCHEGAIAFLHTVDFEDILESGKDYQIMVNCVEDKV